MSELIINDRGDTKFVPTSVRDRFREEPPEFTPTTPRDTLKPWEAHLEEQSRRAEFRAELDPSDDEVFIHTPTDRVQLLYMQGDLHFGHDGLDWDRINQNTHLLLGGSDRRALFLGDMVDNLFFNKDEDSANVTEQITALNSWLNDMRDQEAILAMISGNHDQFLRKTSGMGIELAMDLADGKVPYLRNGGFVNWKVGDQIYKIYVKHKTRYNSDLNPHHTNHRLYWMEAQNADIVATGHQHSLTVEHWAIKQHDEARDVYFAKTGCMKEADSYRDANGFIPRWQNDGVCYCFSPVKHEVWQVVGMEKGCRLQQMLQWEQENNEEIPAKQFVEELSRL